MQNYQIIGYLIYDEEGLCRNRWFADELTHQAAKLGLCLTTIVVDRNASFVCDPLPDFAIVRVIAPHINLFFEEHHIPVFNNYSTSLVANDKLRTYRVAKELGISVMPTTPIEDFDPAKPDPPYPLIVKTRDGHGGSEVFSVSSGTEFNGISEILQARPSLVQTRCSDAGRDVRVYCLGGEILVAILRESQNDFRSNFSLGGHARVFAPTDDMRRVVRILYDALGFDLVGVDFISHNGGWVLNEIEDVVGTRMIYSCTDIDIVAKYMTHIRDKLQHQK